MGVRALLITDSATTHFARQQFLELFDGFGHGERVEKRLSASHWAHGHVAHSHIMTAVESEKMIAKRR